MREIGVRVKLVERGFIRTNFPNAEELSKDRSLREFDAATSHNLSTRWADGVESVVAAEVIFTAATDGTDQLRYTVGEDARLWASQRGTQDDATFFEGMRALFGQ
jgi:hypothetical protein